MRFHGLLMLLLVAAGASLPGETKARNFLATGAQCRAQGGVPDSAITSRENPDPVRNCYVREAMAPTVPTPRRNVVVPHVPTPSVSTGAAGVLGGLAGVLGAGAALIDALPSDDGGAAAAPEPEPQVEAPSPAVAAPRQPRTAPPRRPSPSSPQRIAADEKIEACQALLAARRNVEAKQCFLEAKAMYDEALAAEEAAVSRPTRASLRNAGRTKGKVPEGCLVVGRPTPAGVGCGQRREWYWTPVTIKKNAHCPRDFNIVYVDPEDGKIKPGEVFPGRLQTCGEGVTQAWIDQ